MAFKDIFKKSPTPSKIKTEFFICDSIKKQDELKTQIEDTPLKTMDASMLREVSNKFLMESTGEVEPQELQNAIMRDIGEDHPVNYAVLENAYTKVPIITGGINKTVDFVTGRGYSITCKDPNAKKIVDLFIREQKFDTLLRGVVRDMLVYGNSFLEIVTDSGQIILLKPLNPKFMFVKRDRFGTVKGYTQFFKNRFKKNDFAPEQIAHFAWNKLGDSAYGLSIISPLLPILEDKLNLEHDMAVIVGKKAGAPYHVKMVNDLNPAGNNDITAFKNKLVALRNDQEWVTDHRVEIDLIGAQGKIIDFQPFIQHYENQIIYGLEVPQVLLGQGNIPEGLAVVQHEAFERHAESIQEFIEQPLEDQIFKNLLRINGFKNEFVEFNWKSESQKEKLEEAGKIKEIISLASTGTISDEMRRKLESKLWDLLDLDEVMDKAGETPTAAALMAQANAQAAQEAVRQLEKSEKLEHVHESFDDIKEELDKDYTIQEFIGYAPKVYKEDIIAGIKADTFRRRKIPEVTDPRTGEVIRPGSRYEFEEINAPKVKHVLIQAFEEDHTVNQIAKNLHPYVKALETSAGLVIPKEYRSFVIARTELVMASAEGQRRNYEKFGYEYGQWIAGMDDRTCPDCSRMNGSTHSIDEMKRMIPLHTFCRCRWIPSGTAVIDDEKVVLNTEKPHTTQND